MNWVIRIGMNNKNRKIRPYITGGLSADYLFAYKISGTETRTGAAANDVSGSGLSGLNKFNLGAVLGAGLRIRIAGGFFIAKPAINMGSIQCPFHLKHIPT